MNQFNEENFCYVYFSYISDLHNLQIFYILNPNGDS